MRSRGSSRTRSAVAMACAALSLAYGALAADDAEPPKPDFSKARAYEVVRVLDDYALLLRAGDRTVEVRLLGVVELPDTVAQGGASDARRRAKEFLEGMLQNKSVYVARDPKAPKEDGLGRPLACVYRSDDKLLVNLEVIHQGFATPDGDTMFGQSDVFRTAAQQSQAAVGSVALRGERGHGRRERRRMSVWQ